MLLIPPSCGRSRGRGVACCRAGSPDCPGEDPAWRYGPFGGRFLDPLRGLLSGKRGGYAGFPLPGVPGVGIRKWASSTVPMCSLSLFILGAARRVVSSLPSDLVIADVDDRAAEVLRWRPFARSPNPSRGWRSGNKILAAAPVKAKSRILASSRRLRDRASAADPRGALVRPLQRAIFPRVRWGMRAPSRSPDEIPKKPKRVRVGRPGVGRGEVGASFRRIDRGRKRYSPFFEWGSAVTFRIYAARETWGPLLIGVSAWRRRR